MASGVLKNSGYYKGADDLRNDRSRSSGNNPIYFIPAPSKGESDTNVTLRFLTEMDKWFRFYQHWGKNGPFPCVQDECPGCEGNEKASKKVLANAFLHDEDRVVAIQLPATVMDYLLYRHEKSGTIRDRDFTIIRTGAGKEDTKYMVEPEDKKKFPASRYELFDLESLVEDMIQEDDDEDTDDEDDEDDEDFEEDDDDEDFEDDEDEDDEPEPPRKSSKKKSGGSVKTSRSGVKLGSGSSKKKSSGRKR